MTRTGKTTLARQLLQHEKRILILDPKWCFKELGEECIITSDAMTAVRSIRRANVIYRPKPGEESWNTVLQGAWNSNLKKQNPHTLYVDEVAMVVAGPTSFPPFLRAYWQQGGELGLKALSSTQRPASVPLFLFSESEQHWSFRLLLDKDVKRASEWLGVEDRPSTLHSFFYRDVHAGPAKEFALRLEEDHSGK
jgi:hypothetical protein